MDDSGRGRSALEFSEQLGYIVDNTGWMPRLNGRVLGLILVSDEPLSQADLAERLQTSSGAISTAIRVLLEKGLLEHVSGPLSRRKYFRVPSSAWFAIHEDSLRTVHRYQEIAERALESLEAGGTVEGNLNRMRDYFARVEQCYRDAYPTRAASGNVYPVDGGA